MIIKIEYFILILILIIECNFFKILILYYVFIIFLVFVCYNFEYDINNVFKKIENKSIMYLN